MWAKNTQNASSPPFSAICLRDAHCPFASDWAWVRLWWRVRCSVLLHLERFCVVAGLWRQHTREEIQHPCLCRKATAEVLPPPSDYDGCGLTDGRTAGIALRMGKDSAEHSACAVVDTVGAGVFLRQRSGMVPRRHSFLVFDIQMSFRRSQQIDVKTSDNRIGSGGDCLSVARRYDF